MSYKFLRVTKIYPQFIQQIYRNNINLKEQSYQSQFDYIMSQFFGTADSWEYALKKLNYDAKQIVYNAQTLQQTWAKEHNIQKTELELLFEQIKFYQPEILFIQVTSIISADFLNRLRKEIKSIQLIVIHKCAPTSPKELKTLNQADFVITCTEGMQEYFDDKNISNILIRHAFDSRILEHMTVEQKINEVVFAGSIITHDNFHNERQKLILKLLNDTNIPFSIYGKINNSYTYNHIHLKEETFGLDYYNTMKKYTICFNAHIDIAGKYAGNMRLFEATGIGTCLLTDAKSNISKMFHNEKEILTYDCEEDARHKAKYLLDNPIIAQQIAINGQKRTLDEHSFENRAIEFHEFVNNKI